jgi:tungstate transport system ATP-binding protein
LRDISLDLHGGLCLVLTGANGAGKSTLLRITAGLQPAHRIELFDFGTRRPRAAAARLRRLVTYIHQQPYAFRGEVQSNLGLALPWSIGRRERRRRIEEALHWADLVPLRNAQAIHLSGGERQRLSLARAWLRGTPYLLLDEPTASLDTHSRERTMKLLNKLLQQDRGLLIATHDLDHLAFPGAAHLHLEEGRLMLGGGTRKPQGREEVFA